MRHMDYCDVLGVDPEASEKKVLRFGRRLAPLCYFDVKLSSQQVEKEHGRPLSAQESGEIDPWID